MRSSEDERTSAKLTALWQDLRIRHELTEAAYAARTRVAAVDNRKTWLSGVMDARYRILAVAVRSETWQELFS